MRVLRQTLILFAFTFISVVVASAQTATGEVNGTVSDPNGAAVSGAAVKLINQATKSESETTTNQSGYFTFVNLKPASYVLMVEVTGFKKSVTSAFALGVTETVTQNVSLAVGEMSEVVEVAAGTELVQSSSSELGTVITQRTVEDLPLNGRNFTQLLTLTPGVSPVSTSQNKSIGGVEGNVGIPGSGFVDPSFHGMENRSKLYFYDGIINTNVRGPTYIVIPNIDLVQEFKVVGQDAKAEFGGAMGGVMNMVSKSGGNSFHGSGFEYVRNDAFDARNSFDVCTTARCGTATGVPKKPLPFRQNQFGGTITGPIFKNRTFFSFGYDGWRYSQAALGLSYVPTLAEINGDFTNTPFRRPIYNPYSTRQVGSNLVRDQFRCDSAGNPLPVNSLKQQDQSIGSPCFKIPQALIFGPMQNFFRTYSAAPNFSGDPQNNFAQGRPTLNTANGYQLRIDHRFSDSDNFFFRFTQQNVTVFNPIGDAGSTSGSGKGRNYGGGWTHTFGPNLILDIRAGYAGRPGVDSSQQNQHQAGTDPLKSQGFVDVDKYGGLLVRLSNWTAGSNNDFGVRGAALRENPNWSVTPNFTWLRGAHNLKFGAWYIEAKRIQLNTFQRYTFADEQTRNPTASSGTTGLSLASALLGFPNNFDAQLPTLHGGPVQFKYASWAGYGQDEWRVSRNVVLTLGLRFDYLNQPKTIDGRLWNSFDLLGQRWIIGATDMPPRCSTTNAAPCIPDAFFSDPHFNNVVLAGKKFFAPPPVKDNWGPRVGIAWSLNSKSVLRAGYGLYFDPLPARSQYAQNDLEAAVWPDATAYAGTANTNANFASGSFFNIIQIQGQGFATPLPTASPWTVGGFNDDPNYKDAYSHQWHVEYQRELTKTSMVSVAYVGSVSRRLPYSGLGNTARHAYPAGTSTATVDADRPVPWVGAGLNYTLAIGRASYRALETKFQRRFAQGWSTLVSYTWSRTYDTGSGYFNVENGTGGSASIQNFWDQNTAWGPASYSIPHFLSVSTLYEAPFGKGKRWFRSGPASWILGNWQTNFIAQARSGAPFNLVVTGDLANLRGSGSSAPNNYLRPNQIADPYVAGPVAANPDPNCQKTISQGGRAADQTRTIVSWINPCAFTSPFGAFGDFPRNGLRGAPVYNVDFSMFKSIPVSERFKVQFRMEAFNVFNIQSWEVPSTVTINSSGSTIAAGVGRITSLAQGKTPRQIQFGLRLIFRETSMNRRDYLTAMGAAAGALATVTKHDLIFGQQQPAPADTGAPTTSTVEDRERRMKWWHEAKFGMFIHWGLYSTLGRHEWVMENEGIPVSEYEKLAPNFKPIPNAARAWAQLAKRAGMKYMVMTSKHHEGFCNFDTKLTDYCATKQGPGRDLVREYVDAARAEGLRFGFYYSLMDWHHPDGARCKTDEAARRRFVDYIHGQVRELMTNYGKVDILWYDVAWPLDAAGWESVEMNKMVRKLQPDIIINNRSKIPEDFDTPEQQITASQNRPWESCMTLNDSWGYHAADFNWKSPTTVIRNLITCARDGGNYLLNIGPKGDGSIPEESVRILTTVGDWMSRNGATIRESEAPCQPRRGNYLSFTRKGNTLYAHVHYWPGETVVIGNLLNKVSSVKMFATGQPVKFVQDDFRIRLTGLPKKAPDVVTTFALELDSVAKQDHEGKRAVKPREGMYNAV